ncbi:TetR/AcrR family transcriptional regulator [Mesorhizobium sp. CAU 1732]|uniref:TetR/AcrR family transcriptional regulator n=1 Tax=Mesorhizobium sp. CAU 1732 TaxID=3140358 RepID=UPI00325FF1CF
MGRKRTIDRDAILDAAEAIVTEMGAGRLTFDAIAKRAGVSKGGVLYCFASKQELVGAMAKRDMDRFERDIAAHRAGMEPSDAADILAHLAATRQESDALAAKAASLMAALVETPEHAEPIRSYYRDQMGRFGGASQKGRRERLAFFAAEGAFLLRGLGLVRMTEDEWSSLFEDMEELAKGKG